jgi:hypothetical protein
MSEKQIRELSRYLREMNELLEKILHAQFGIEDRRWLEAISTIEEGFSKAVNFIAEVKGKKLPIFLTKEDVDEILEG